MAPKLVGLAGYARTGKDTVAGYLAEQHGYERLAFADKLRELALEIDPLIDGEGYIHPVPWKLLVKANGYEGAKELGGREMLVKLGAGCRKVLGPDVWLDALLPLPKQPHTGVMPFGSAVGELPTVVSDVRYLNEAQRIVDLGGEVWYISRPGVGPANDEERRSIEQMLVHGPAVILIENWDTLTELHHQVDLTLAHARA
jgi:hypothetical protein